jgi:VanZ family protein
MLAVEARSQSTQVALRSLAPLGLMALIFVLSAQPDLDSGLGALDLVLRKLAHATVYAFLTLAWAWALRPVTRLSVPLAASIALLYAVSDEYHQTFVDGRSGTSTDVLIDAIGVCVALALLRYHRWVRSAVIGTGSQG